jgi:hypothetical protein
MGKATQMTFIQALDAVLSGYEVRSYDSYELTNVKGNIYVRHNHDDRRKRLINHDELQMLKDKKFYIAGDDASWESYTNSLFNQ